jgi:DNA polymerase-3 subunit beta
VTATLSRPRTAFRCDLAPLKAAVHAVARRIPTRPATPQVAGILIRLTGDRLTLAAFDYEVAVTAALNVDGSHDGAVLVSGRLLTTLIDTLPAKPVEASMAGSRLALDCGSVHVELPSMSVEDYPTLPDLPEPAGHVDAAAFANTIRRVAVATGDYADLPILTGMVMNFAAQITLVATDRYRAATDVLNWTPAPGTDLGREAIVPANVLAEVVPSIAAGADTIAVHLSDGLFGLAGPAVTIVARTMSEAHLGMGLLKNWPARSDTPVTIDADEFAGHLNRANKVHERKTPIRLTLNGPELHIGATGADTTAVAASMAVSYEGEPIEILSNPAWLLDAVKACGSSTVEVSFTGRKTAYLVTPIADGDTYRQLVMPVRPPA